MTRQKITSGVLALCMMAGALHSTHVSSGITEPVSSPVYAITPSTSKESSKSIKLSWDSTYDAFVQCYYVMKRSTTDNGEAGGWETIAEVTSDSIAGGLENSYIDKLKSSSPQQYEYKICTLSKDGLSDTRENEYATDQYSVLGTNIKICIDPGHYGTKNNNYDLEGGNGKYPYSEAKFTLKIGEALEKELKQTYGIDSYMTRTGNKISLAYKGKTYTNTKLDQGNIAIRGYMAKTKDCDFFISLHTNMAGREKKPWNQPKSLNRVYVFVNSVALKSSRGMNIANAIGSGLTVYNKAAGIQNAGFVARNKNKAANYANLANDISKGNGTVIHRKGSLGNDYYGVLRGSSEKGVEGIIVEHAFHDTQVMRKQAEASTALYQNWAVCDAYGIAKGFGIEAKNNNG